VLLYCSVTEPAIGDEGNEAVPDVVDEGAGLIGGLVKFGIDADVIDDLPPSKNKNYCPAQLDIV
jgi:hypothetical protein